MKYEIVAVHDRALDAYNRPIFVPTLGAASRMFLDEVNRKDSESNKHPEDYDLYHLGTWDDATGKFVNALEPKQIARGKDVITD